MTANSPKFVCNFRLPNLNGKDRYLWSALTPKSQNVQFIRLTYSIFVGQNRVNQKIVTKIGEYLISPSDYDDISSHDIWGCWLFLKVFNTMRSWKQFQIEIDFHNNVASTLVSSITARGLSMTEVDNLQPGYLWAWINFSDCFVASSFRDDPFP